MVPDALFEAVPSDWDSLSKIAFEPFSEAQTDFRLVIAFILQGAYKTAYHHLRSFFELHMVAFYCLLPSTPKTVANAWINGKSETPYFNRMMRALFAEPNFQFAEARFDFKNQLNSTYHLLCNYVHSGGPAYRHLHVSKANYPRFIPESLEDAVTNLHRVLGDVATAFVLYSPVLLKPLPVEQKFGINGPLSGFLEERQVEDMRYAIGPDRLPALDELVAADPDVAAVEEWFLSKADITEAELKRQLAEHESLMNQMGPRPEDRENTGNLSTLFDG